MFTYTAISNILFYCLTDTVVTQSLLLIRVLNWYIFYENRDSIQNKHLVGITISSQV